jgi:hypothetical protein
MCFALALRRRVRNDAEDAHGELDAVAHMWCLQTEKILDTTALSAFSQQFIHVLLTCANDEMIQYQLAKGAVFAGVYEREEERIVLNIALFGKLVILHLTWRAGNLD